MSHPGPSVAPYLDRRQEIEPGLLRIVEAALELPPTRYVAAWFERLAWRSYPGPLFERERPGPRGLRPSGGTRTLPPMPPRDRSGGQAAAGA